MTCLQTFSLEETTASAPDAALTDKEPVITLQYSTDKAKYFSFHLCEVSTGSSEDESHQIISL